MAWDVDSLKEYVDSRLDDQQRAVVIANTANEKRLDAVNEFRAQLSDQTRSFLTRNEFIAQHESLSKRVDELTNRINLITGRSTGYSASWGIITTAIAGAAAVIAIIYYLSHLH